jgi:hypothetical protein
MPTTPFRPFRRNPPTSAFPAWIIDELDLIPLPDVHFIQPHTTYIKPFIEASGLTPEELCERMQSSRRKTIITPELIEKTLTSDDPEMWIISSIFKALDVSWEGYRKFEEEYHERIERASRTRRDAHDLITNYRQYGPCLYALQTAESWIPTAGLADPYHFMRQIEFGSKSKYDPPDAEQISTWIAQQPETCVHPVVREFYCIGGFLYHRLPNELHLYDPQGHIIASGGVDMEIPNHLWLTKRLHRHVRIKKKTPPRIPTNRNKPPH